MREAAADPSAAEWPLDQARESAARDAPLHRYFPSLDGLRAVSILWVLSLHLPGQMPPAGNPITNRGHFGVEIFFAISGFLVTRSLHQCYVRAAKTAGSKLDVARDFLIRRISRIWPPYFLALLAALAGALVDATFRENLREADIALWSFPTFLANYTIPYREPPLSLLVMWSLCFEEQFYVILIGLYLIGARRLTGWLVACAAGSIALRFGLALAQPEAFGKFVMQMQTHLRFDALAWGCLAWIFHERIAAFWTGVKHRRLLEASIVVATVLVCVPDPLSPLGQAASYFLMAPVFTALVVALAFSPGFWLARWLAVAPLAFVGVISYEIYLSHVSVYRVLNRLGLEDQRWVYYPACIVLSLIAAWLFHRLFSLPTQKWVRRLTTPRPRPESTAG